MTGGLDEDVGGGNLEIYDSQIVNNGNGVGNTNDLVLKRSIVSGNSGVGVLLLGAGNTATIENSTIDNNAYLGVSVARDRDSAVRSDLTISQSTISNNGNKGGLYLEDAAGKFSIINSTITGNTSDKAGGISVRADFPDEPDEYAINLNIKNSTISSNTGNSQAGGIDVSEVQVGRIVVKNSIIANNKGTTPDIAGTFSSSGYNLIGDGTGGTGFTAAGDLVGNSNIPIDPKLGLLDDNGGPTLTQALPTWQPSDRCWRSE